jgi:nucleolar MIF4G domain-containing protein 1
MQLDAAERLLRLPLRATAERDIPRIILHCCLQERAWNPYYALVTSRIAAARKSHKTTLQFMVWDKVKALNEFNPRQALNFGRFLATLLVGQVGPAFLQCLLPDASVSS